MDNFSLREYALQHAIVHLAQAQEGGMLGDMLREYAVWEVSAPAGCWVGAGSWRMVLLGCARVLFGVRTCWGFV